MSLAPSNASPHLAMARPSPVEDLLAAIKKGTVTPSVAHPAPYEQQPLQPQPQPQPQPAPTAQAQTTPSSLSEYTAPGALGVESPTGSSRRGSHQLMAALGCERAYALRYVSRLVEGPGEEPSYRMVGTLVHLLLAYHYANKLQNPPKWFLEKTAEDALNETGAGYPDEIRTAVDVFATWRRHFTVDPWHPLFVEEEFYATIGDLDPTHSDPETDHEVISFRLDLVAAMNELAVIVDHKCSGGSYGKRLQRWKEDSEYGRSLQVLLYQRAMALILPTLIGARPEGFFIQRIKRSAPYDFDRHRVLIDPIAYEDSMLTVRAAVKREREIRAKLASGQKLTPSIGLCDGRYGPCTYASLCYPRSKDHQQKVVSTRFQVLAS